MSTLLIAWLITLPPVLLVGFAFGFAAGRERERRRWLGRKRTCCNCSGWGHIRTGLPLIGMAWTCPDCHGRGWFRELPTPAPSTANPPQPTPGTARGEEGQA